MKADILRRAEAITDEEDEDEEAFAESGIGKGKGKEKSKAVVADMGPDDDEDDIVALRIAGDGEDSGDEDEDDEHEDGEHEEQQAPETIVELAYLRDPKVFERDAVTRRSKARSDLKAQTGKIQTFFVDIYSLSSPLFQQAGMMAKSKGGKSCWTEM